MNRVIDLNPGSGFVYGRTTSRDRIVERLNARIDAALIAANRDKPPRDYLGASRIGEPCSRRLAYEMSGTQGRWPGLRRRDSAHLRRRPPTRRSLHPLAADGRLRSPHR